MNTDERYLGVFFYELFSTYGCGRAQTPAEAAAYIEDFVRRRRAEAEVTARTEKP